MFEVQSRPPMSAMNLSRALAAALYPRACLPSFSPESRCLSISARALDDEEQDFENDDRKLKGCALV